MNKQFLIIGILEQFMQEEWEDDLPDDAWLDEQGNEEAE